MPTTIDCILTGDMYSSEAMRRIFDSSSKLQSWLDVEAALAEAEAAVGVIPEQAARTIRGVARAKNFDMCDLRQQVDDGRRHIIYPMITALADLAGDDAGKYVHWGATTQDILDTGLILQVRQALDVIDTELAALVGALESRAREHRDTVVAARTHWQHALPMTLGLKFAVLVDEFRRHQSRLSSIREPLLRTQLAGGGGTLASLGEHADAVQSEFARILGLARPTAPWFASRDTIADLVSILGMVAGTVERFVLGVGRLAGTEIAEVFEPRRRGQVGSSTMPQKRNPILSERTAATCKLIRGYVPVAQSTMVVEHDRDMATYMAEWFVVPQTMMMTGRVVVNARYIAEEMTFDTERMAENLKLTRGGIVSEAVMMGLAPVLGRVRAHELTLEAAQIAHEAGTGLLEALRRIPEVVDSIDDSELARMVEPARYTGTSAAVVDRVAPPL